MIFFIICTGFFNFPGEPCSLHDCDWLKFVWHRSLWEPPQCISQCIRLSFQSSIDPNLLVLCLPLPHLLNLPENWILLSLSYLGEFFFLLITYLKLLLRCPFLQQLKLLTLWCLQISLKIAFPTLVLVFQSNVSTLIVCKIHSPMVCRCDQ